MFFLINLGKTDYDRYWESLTTEEKKRIIEEECDADEQDFLRQWDGTRYMKYLDQDREGLATFWYWFRTAFNCLAIFLDFAFYFAVIIGLAYLMVEHSPMISRDVPWYLLKMLGLIGCGIVLTTIPALIGLHAAYKFSEWIKYKVKF